MAANSSAFQSDSQRNSINSKTISSIGILFRVQSSVEERPGELVAKSGGEALEISRRIRPLKETNNRKLICLAVNVTQFQYTTGAPSNQIRRMVAHACRIDDLLGADCVEVVLRLCRFASSTQLDARVKHRHGE